MLTILCAGPTEKPLEVNLSKFILKFAFKFPGIDNHFACAGIAAQQILEMARLFFFVRCRGRCQKRAGCSLCTFGDI